MELRRSLIKIKESSLGFKTPESKHHTAEENIKYAQVLSACESSTPKSRYASAQQRLQGNLNQSKWPDHTGLQQAKPVAKFAYGTTWPPMTKKDWRVRSNKSSNQS